VAVAGDDRYAGSMVLGGRVAVVTGAARRVGRAIALELGRAGARVVVHHHASPQQAGEVVSALGDACAVQADLRQPAGIATLLEGARAFGGGIDVLVNSASEFERRPFEQIDDEQWQAMLDLTLLAPVRLCRGVVGDMRARGGGVIINILDVAALSAWRGYAHHCAAKAALAMLTRCLALELAPTIRACGVAPGTVLFPESFSEDQRARVERRIPLGRAGSAEDVARAVRFLCEEDFLDGVILPVDGGRLADSGEG
jgi:pteridine reductase